MVIDDRTSAGRVCQLLSPGRALIAHGPVSDPESAVVEVTGPDNSRHSIIHMVLHFSVANLSTISYYIPKDSLYFSLSNNVNDEKFPYIFQKLLSLQ